MRSAIFDARDYSNSALVQGMYRITSGQYFYSNSLEFINGFSFMTAWLGQNVRDMISSTQQVVAAVGPEETGLKLEDIEIPVYT